MKRNLLLIVLAFGLAACSYENEAQEIVDKSIRFYGMDTLKSATLEFDFRKFHFKVEQKDGNFKYQRTFSDSTGNVHDILENGNFKRTVNGKQVRLSKKDELKFTEAVNAVVYFVYLPLKLNDESALKKYLGESRINGKAYHKVEVRFEKSGGGKDYDDVFYYWFDTSDFSMDHLAYSSGGNRFRAVLEVTAAEGGLKFQNYINYESPPGDSVTPLISYDSLYNAGKLKELSRIEINNVKVN